MDEAIQDGFCQGRVRIWKNHLATGIWAVTMVRHGSAMAAGNRSQRFIQPVQDGPDQARTGIDQAGINLHQHGSSVQFFLRICRVHDPTHSDDRQSRMADDIADHFGAAAR
jgi:hypothetical protein